MIDIADLHSKYPTGYLADARCVGRNRLAGMLVALGDGVFWTRASDGCGLGFGSVRRLVVVRGAPNQLRLPRPEGYAGTIPMVVAFRSLRRLWQSACRSHSPCAPARPRRRSCPAFWRVLICPNTGSTIALRRA